MGRGMDEAARPLWGFYIRWLAGAGPHPTGEECRFGTHTHTHTQRERDREIEGEIEGEGEGEREKEK